MEVKIKKLREQAVVPARASLQAAGADLYAALDGPETIYPGETLLVPLGFATEFETGFVGLIYARSGLATKKGLAPANKVGVIDADYRGEWMVALHNHSQNPQVVNANERVAQVVFQKVELVKFIEVDELEDTQRGDGGFGSTGQ